MRRVELTHIGQNAAAGFLIDPVLLGHSEAQRRVLRLWEPDCALYGLPDNRWLITIPHPIRATDTSAPGLIAVLADEGLSTGPCSPHDETDALHTGLTVTGWHNGDRFHYELSATSRIDPASWIEAGPTTVLRPISAPSVVAPVAEAQPPPPVDLRAAASVGDRSKQSARFLTELRSRPGSGRTKDTRSAAGKSHARPQPRVRRDSAFAKLVLKTPLRSEIGRKHAKYIERLTQQFNNGKFEDALRDAIAVGGAGGALSLRLPGRRSNLDISPGGGGVAGRSVPFGPAVSGHLNQVYQRAAKELESQGRIDEAAFVLAELLNMTVEAVALYERHGLYRSAAALASNRDLDAALVARLWWRAGDTDRSIRIARKSGNFAAVMKRIDEADPELARDFRLAWVNHLERCGNALGAVEVGWTDPSIRPMLRSVISRGISLGGNTAVPLLAYRFALSPDEHNRAEIETMLEEIVGDDPAIRLFVEAVANVEIKDTTTDRELCTRTTRAALPSHQQSDKPFVVAYRKVRDRADPILRADTPAQPWGRPAAGATVEVGPIPAGTIPIADAAQIAKDMVLVALGEMGTRIMRPDGRVIVHWDVPAHELVVADHGGSALLIASRGQTIDAHHLDLTTRRVRRYGTLDCSVWARSFDGATWAAFDSRGLGFYDVLAEAPTTIWRELDGTSTWQAIARSSAELTAIVTAPEQTNNLHLWKWEIPTMRLLAKPSFVQPDMAQDMQILADGTTIWQFDDGRPSLVVDPDGRPSTPLADSKDVVEVLADGVVVGRRLGDGQIVLQEGTTGQPVARFHSDANAWKLRSSPSFCTVSDSAGRVFGISRRSPHPPIAMRVIA